MTRNRVDPEGAFPAGTGSFGLYLPKTAGPALVESLDILNALVLMLPEKGRMLEIGTWCGASAAYIADQRPYAEIVSVDSFFDLSYHLTIPLWIANARPNMRLWIGDSLGFMRTCQPGIFDVVFIDGDHGEAAVQCDLKAASVLVTPEGKVALHDYSKEWPTVVRGVDAFCESTGRKIVEQIFGFVVLE